MIQKLLKQIYGLHWEAATLDVRFQVEPWLLGDMITPTIRSVLAAEMYEMLESDDRSESW